MASTGLLVLYKSMGKLPSALPLENSFFCGALMAQSLILGHNKTFHKRVIQNVKKIIQDTQIGNSLADCKQ